MSEAINVEGIELKEREEPKVVPVEKRYTLRLSPEAAETLEWIANARGGVSAAEVIRRALGTERILIEEAKGGSAIVLERPGQRPRELVLR